MKSIIFSLLIGTCVLLGQASPTIPALPTSIPTGVRPTPTGSVINVHTGNNLQAIYNAAACGSDIVLDAGSTFTGNYVFNKQCSAPNWILVEGAGCQNGSAPIPTYTSTVTANYGFTAPFAPPSLLNYATITTASSAAIVTTDVGFTSPGSFNYFGCLELASPTGGFNYGLLIFAQVATAETLTGQFGHDFIADRLYIHGNPSDTSNMVIHGLVLAGANVAVVNSYFSNVYYNGGDAQAIIGWAGPGPYLIKNNFLSASTENILFGGTGKTPFLSCTVNASPAPTTTAATVSNCIDAANNPVPSPPVGTQVTFYTSASMPFYSPLDSVTITGNATGALIFPALATGPPLTGAGKIVWGMRPADITVVNNYFWKNPCWDPSQGCYDGINRLSKNFYESKYGQREYIHGNIFNYFYANGQQTAFNFNSADQNGDCPWCFSSDITFQNNLIKNIGSAFAIIGTEAGGSNNSCPALVNRILINNNLWWTNNQPPLGQNYLFSLTRDNGGCTFPQNNGSDSLQIIHNTFLGGGYNGALTVPPTPVNFSNLVLRNNLTEFDQVGWFIDYKFTPDPSFGTSTSSGTWSADHNAIINSGAIHGNLGGFGGGVNDATLLMRYGSIVLSTFYDTTGATNYSGDPFLNYANRNVDYHGFQLVGSGPWRNAASDGTDPGVNMSLLDADIGIVFPPFSFSSTGNVRNTGNIQKK